MNTHLIHHIRTASSHPTLVIGVHMPIIQSMLDFDYLSGKKATDIVGIINGKRGFVKVFWGAQEMMLPTYVNQQAFVKAHPDTLIEWIVNVLSARRAVAEVEHALHLFPTLQGGVVFAEGVPERQSLTLSEHVNAKGALIIGPATVGLLIPGVLKLGPIAGVDPTLWESIDITEGGDTAVISASGGMTGELISLVYQSGKKVSFALSYGGDRWPICTPMDAFLLAEGDPQTTQIVYYGELGGTDEYELIELVKQKKVTKRIVAHIAGTVGEIFPESPQFGHAKAKAHMEKEKASAKRAAMREAGIITTQTFSEVGERLKVMKN